MVLIGVFPFLAVAAIIAFLSWAVESVYIAGISFGWW